VRHHVRIVSAVLVLAAMSAAGCSDTGGRSLDAPRPGATVPSTTSAPALQPTEVLTLTSSAFAEGQPIPDLYSCKGEDLSPPLEWSSVPAAAAELAIVVRDRDAGGFVHWVISGIPSSVTGLAPGAIPEEAVEGLNSFGEAGWRGPCPPSGTHTYELRLHILSEPLGLAPGLPANDAATLVEGASIDTATLTGTFTA
jgi:Raf kinase inhibitor-like YbhB/YbcL family protein